MTTITSGPQIYINSLSLLFAGRDFDEKCARVKKAGFDGIELVVFTPSQLAQQRKIVQNHDLELTLHQPWSYSEGGGMLSNRLLSLAGVLPKEGYLLKDILEQANDEIFVAYADRWQEIKKWYELKEDMPRITPVFQTASAWNGSGLNRGPRMQYEMILKEIITGMPQVEIVYDTVHALELMLRAPTGRDLMMYSEKNLIDATRRAVQDMKFFEGRGQEIHFNDLNNRGTDGRCLAGNGKLNLALKWLARQCIKKRWHGRVIPEVSPLLFLFKPEKNLARVKRRIQRFFG